MSLEEVKKKVREAGYHVPEKVKREWISDNGTGRIMWRDHSILIERDRAIYHHPTAARTADRWKHILFTNPVQKLEYLEF